MKNNKLNENPTSEVSSPEDGSHDPASPEYASWLLERWQHKLPAVDASAVPLFSMATALGRQMEQILEGILKPSGLQLSEYRLMTTLLTYGENGLTPAQLNAVLKQTSAGATKTIARVEERALIQRRANPDDNRSVVIELTTAGERFIIEICSSIALEQRKKLAWLTDQQRQTALEGLQILLQSLK